jgi:hypothetical protein
MGITVAFYRISAAQYEETRRTQDEGAVHTVMRNHRVSFPYSLYYLELDKLYGLLDGFINPTRDPNAVLWQVLNGGKVLDADEGLASNGVYLNVLYYFDPPMVATISRAMAAIDDVEDMLNRYKTMMGIASNTEVVENTAFPTYRDTLEMFREAFCFFHIAEEAGDAIVRYHNG